MQEKILGELIFARIHAGPVFALARIQENIFEEAFPEYCGKFLGEFMRCEYMPRLYSHPREYRKIFLANYLCIGFVPGGTHINCLGISFNYTHICYTKELFPNYLCNHLGPQSKNGLNIVFEGSNPPKKIRAQLAVFRCLGERRAFLVFVCGRPCPPQGLPGLKECQGVSEYSWKSDWENRCALILSYSNRESQQYSGTALGRLRVRFGDRLGKPMGLFFEPFLKPIGRANSTRRQP